MMRKVRMLVFNIWNICRHPPSRKIAWIFVVAWAAALILPGLSIALNPNRGLDLTIWVGWSNLICMCLDGFMLTTSIRGLLWRRRLEKAPQG